MRNIYQYALGTLLMLILTGPISPSAQAHLMVAQHGTLNIIDNGVFMVLSLPSSAFEGIDDDADGKVSMVEFNNHRAAIVESVRQNVTLSDDEGNCTLHGIMLSPVAPHDGQTEQISQLTVMGRFSLGDPNKTLSFHNGLYGMQATEQSLLITATGGPDNQKHVFELTPGKSMSVLFADTEY